ncbi:MAG TPA: hypothetical protein PLX68_05995 [Dermatophilaceae bacterium]|jgi:hypothetical protein|nr:hypothetical protein [Ornithinibacter sp.]HRC12402.1 hypothetical protein [Dermatophilaceae bacterium]
MERAIDALSDPGVSTADALRRLLVVARRIGAVDLATWIKRELDGYSDQEEVPEYRDGSGLPIAIRFDGYGGASSTRRMSAQDLPSELNMVLDTFTMSMPLAELEALAGGGGDGDPQRQLPNVWLHRYRELAAENRVPHMPMFTANHAAVVVPRTYLRGLLDRIKTVALDLALDIEDVSPEAGDRGGPTVESEPALRTAVASHMTMIFAHDSTVAIASGSGAVALQVQVGDIAGLLAAARTILDERGLREFETALREDGDEPGPATRSFLDRVRSGTFTVASGLAVNGAYDGLVALLAQVFPGFS